MSEQDYIAGAVRVVATRRGGMLPGGRPSGDRP